VPAIVLFGDVIRSRADAPAATAWLRHLATDLGRAYGADERLARFEFTQGDELQGLLAASADPMTAVFRAALHPDHRPMRWTIVVGEVDPGRGPATQRSGPAFIAARERLISAAARRERLAVVTGDTAADALLDAISPLLGELLAELTPRQREIAWLMLVEGLRQADVAERLAVTRATISVATDRAHIPSLGAVAAAVTTLVRRATMTSP
jgi:hypothetical protein